MPKTSRLGFFIFIFKKIIKSITGKLQVFDYLPISMGFFTVRP